MENYWILSKNLLLHKIYHSCFILVDLYLLRSKQRKYWNCKKENLLAVSILFSKQGQNNCFNDYDITEIWYNISIISSFDIENVKQCEQFIWHFRLFQWIRPNCNLQDKLFKVEKSVDAKFQSLAAASLRGYFLDHRRWVFRHTLYQFLSHKKDNKTQWKANNI